MPALSSAQRAVLALAAIRLTLAEALWASTLHGAPGWFGEGTDERITVLLGLGTEDGHDELTRCDEPTCRTFFWADEGGRVLYESGREMEMCAEHAVADDPGARVYPGIGLLAEWQDREAAAVHARILATGRSW